MNEFQAAFEKLMVLEGGFVLHKVSGDRGGLTYAGISQRSWPDWEGWELLESKPDDFRAPNLAKEFYAANYWDKLWCEQMPGAIAIEVFCFGVVAGAGTSAKLAQRICGAKADGRIGPATIEQINEMEATAPGLFVPHFKLGQIARYAAIVSKDKSQRKFLLGWINRALA